MAELIWTKSKAIEDSDHWEIRGIVGPSPARSKVNCGDANRNASASRARDLSPIGRNRAQGKGQSLMLSFYAFPTYLLLSLSFINLFLVSRCSSSCQEVEISPLVCLVDRPFVQSPITSSLLPRLNRSRLSFQNLSSLFNSRV